MHQFFQIGPDRSTRIDALTAGQVRGDRQTIDDHGDKHATIKIPSTRFAVNSQIRIGERHSDMQLNTMIERVILQPNTEAAIR